jgi:toxin ParE1/3/4
VRITGPARRDIAAIMHWSLHEFGEDAALRYETLIFQAFRDIAENPERPGAQQRPELAQGVLAYHLRHSRERTRTRTVRTPRHFVIYRRQDSIIEILRLLHDARELERHLAEHRTAVPEGGS